MIIEPIVPYVLLAAVMGFTVAALDYILIEEEKISQLYKHIKFWGGLSLATFATYQLTYPFWANFFLLVSMVMVYWIVFERILNYFREKPAFYIGVNSYIDRFLRLLWGELGGYYAYLFKLVIAFISACLFTYLIYL